MAPHPQVVALRDVMRQHDARVLAHARQHRQQHVALQRLRLVDDDERVVQRTPTDVRQWQHLEQVARDDLVDDLLAHDGAERVEHRLSPRAHLVVLTARQVPELLAADGVQRAEDDHLAVRATLHDRLEARAQRERALAGAGLPAEADDADVEVAQQVDGDALLGGAPVQPEQVAVAAHDLHHVSRHDAPERRTGRLAVGAQDDAGVDGQILEAVERDAPRRVQGVDLTRVDAAFDDARPPRVGHPVGAVLIGRQPGCGRLDAHRQVLAHHRHVVALGREVGGDREDARVVVTESETRGQGGGVGVVEFDAQRAAITDRDGVVEAAVTHAQVVEQAQALTRIVAELGVMTLGLELGDDDDWEHDVVLGEPGERARVGQQHGRVEHVRLDALGDGGVRRRAVIGSGPEARFELGGRGERARGALRREGVRQGHRRFLGSRVRTRRPGAREEPSCTPRPRR